VSRMAIRPRITSQSTPLMTLTAALTHTRFLRHINAYTNPNLTTWEQAGNTWPKNSLMGEC